MRRLYRAQEDGFRGMGDAVWGFRLITHLLSLFCIGLSCSGGLKGEISKHASSFADVNLLLMDKV